MPNPWTHALPPNTRAVGTVDPANDANASVDALTAMGALFNVLNPAFAGGADPAGAGDSQPAFTAAIAALPAAGGTIIIPPGTYKLNSAVTATIAPTASVRIIGAGLGAAILNYAGTGDAIRIRASSFSGGWAEGCELAGFTIDGTSAGAGSNGLHIGDINAARVNIQVSNFTGAGSAGIFFENTTTWTEQGDYRAILNNCTQAVVFSKSGTGTTSFGYGNYDFTIWTAAASGGQDGIVISNGVLVYHGSLRARGNFQSSSSALTSAALRFTGSSTLAGCRLDVQVETPSGVNHPTTIIMDAGSSFKGCYGTLDFSYGGGTFTPAATGLGQVIFTGIISGDVNLSPGAPYGAYVWASSGSPQVLNAEISGYHGSGFPTVISDVFTWTLTANLTANLTSTFYNGTKTLGIAQRVTIIIRQAASGGPYTVTWPVSGIPATALPTILWAAGSVPVMSTAANAVDVADLETADGATWYGVYRQAFAGSGGPAAPPVSPLALAPSGATGQTFDRSLCNQTTAVLVSGQSYVSAIPLPAGLPVTNLGVLVGSTAFAGVTHGWMALLDSSRVVLAATADQTSSFGSASTALPLPAAGSFTTQYSGLYYLAVCVVASTMGVLAIGNQPLGVSVATPPALAGTSTASLTTPPAVSSTMGAITSSGSWRFYAYTS